MVVEANGYEKFRQEIDIFEGALPKDILLEPIVTPTLTPSTTPTISPTPFPPTNTPTFTPSPTNTSTSTPTYTPTPTPTVSGGSLPATPTKPTLTPTIEPEPSPLIRGEIAIPITSGEDFKVFITEFDGAENNEVHILVNLDNAQQPMFRRDGQAVVINSMDNSVTGLVVVDSNGEDSHPINNNASAHWPVWSPDGSEIIFADVSQNNRLFRQSSQGAFSASEVKEVTATNDVAITGKNVIWSDDNQLIYWGCAEWLAQPNECGIWITDADEIDPTRILITKGLPTDVKKGMLTYMSNEDGDWDIFVVSLDGGQPVNITDNDSQDGLAAIAPDGQSIAYISNESDIWALWTITLSDNKKIRWLDIDPQLGSFDMDRWAEERLSWTK